MTSQPASRGRQLLLVAYADDIRVNISQVRDDDLPSERKLTKRMMDAAAGGPRIVVAAITSSIARLRAYRTIGARR